MLLEKSEVGLTAFEQVAMQCQCDDQIGTRPRLEVKVRSLGGRGAQRIDHDEFRPASFRLLQDRDQMDTSGGGVRSPNDDQAGVDVVGQGDAAHLAVEPDRGARRRCRANRAQESRGAEAAEEHRVGGAVGEDAVRTTVAVGKDRLTAGTAPRLEQPFGDLRERLVPGDASEFAGALAAGTAPRGHATQRVEHAVGTVHVFGKSPDLRTDRALRILVPAVGVELHDLAVFDLHREAAGVGTVERAGRGKDGDARLDAHEPKSVAAAAAFFSSSSSSVRGQSSFMSCDRARSASRCPAV